MQRTSLLTVASIAIVFETVAVTIPAAGQPVLPGGSAIISPRVPPGSDSCTPPPGPPVDDSSRIQTIITTARGTVFFQAGCYYLRNPLHLRSGLTYMGEGSWHPRYGSTLMQFAPPDPVTGMGVPIFIVDGVVDSVKIVGLTFDAPSKSLNARGIAAASRGSLLTRSTIEANFFLTELQECIDTPMFGTRIENNEFGANGGPTDLQRHRHIHSLYPLSGGPSGPAENWIVGNEFRAACCATSAGVGPDSESVLFESPAALHVINNDFEDGDTDTTLRLHLASQIFIGANWFEGNHGESQITFSRTGATVDMKDNQYVMQGKPAYSAVCKGQPYQGNCFVAQLELPSSPSPISASLPGTRILMGYEAGGAFTSAGELVPPNVFAACILTITGPFSLGGYSGNELGPIPNCH